jgi:uncharacterized protein with PQ loop repeat
MVIGGSVQRLGDEVDNSRGYGHQARSQECIPRTGADVRCPAGPSKDFSVIFRLMFIKTNKKQKREILEVAYFVAVVQPIMVLPQAIQILANHSAGQVSLLTWAMLLLFNTSNFIYALVFNIKPIIINNAIWVAVDSLVVIGILIYR